MLGISLVGKLHCANKVNIYMIFFAIRYFEFAWHYNWHSRIFKSYVLITTDILELNWFRSYVLITTDILEFFWIPL